MTAPRATYRLQLHAGFTFADAAAIVPYLAGLGISHVYASPITTAVPGSIHGYDVIDPTRINPELGGEAGLKQLVAALRAEGMGLIADIVPNHMGVAGDANPWWLDVLQNGRESEYASVFDIDWDGPIVLPVLGAPFAEVVAAGDLRLVERGDELGLKLYDKSVYPLRHDDPVLSTDRAAAFACHDPQSEEGRAALGELAERQHYRLTYWRAANDVLNWRRFFSINELAGVRVEDPAVFDRTHALVIDLYRRGLIDGVRVDHVDGLADPAGYCRRLRATLETAVPGRRAYIVVEKILAPDEQLPADWDVEGTSGYDFMREVSALLHDPAGIAPLQAFWERLSGRAGDFAAETVEGRRDLLAWQFEGQLRACVRAFAALAEATGSDWLTEGMLRRAIERMLWVFPVYRTYGTGTGAPPGDAPVREAVREAALALAPPGEDTVVEIILGWLAGEGEGEGDPDLRRDAVRRFQQLSAPIAAKGVEDTAFYRSGALLSANDVGFEPTRMAEDIAAFHKAMLRRARDYPGAMLATGTHDHKRGEDGRARLAVLSAVPRAWEQAVARWLVHAAPHVEGIDPADSYMLFQTLVGAWDGDPAEMLPRIHAWQEKALREAKLRSSWEAPEADYEGRCKALADALLSPGRTPAFIEDFAAFMAALAPAAAANTIAQTALHYLVPGVPDLYQGAELPDYSMVDPDNRRPVDFALRRTLLSESDGPAGKIGIIHRLLGLRAARPGAFDGGYTPLAVSGERAAHIVAFSRGEDADRIDCAVAVRLGAVLFGATSAIPAPEWWGDTRVAVAGREIPARDLLSHDLFAVRQE